MKKLCNMVNCTTNVKEYKSNPEAFDGHVGDVSTIVRVALTGRTNTPDLYSITKLLGESAVQSRLSAALEYYREAK